MSKKLKYSLEIGVSENTNVEELEEFLQTILLDLYENSGVESIHVTRHGETASYDDIDELVEIIDGLENKQIRRAIESVRELEDVGDDG